VLISAPRNKGVWEGEGTKTAIGGSEWFALRPGRSLYLREERSGTQRNGGSFGPRTAWHCGDQNLWFQASVAKYKRYPPLWDITQRIVVTPYRRFGTMYRSHIQGSIDPKRKKIRMFSLARWREPNARTFPVPSPAQTVLSLLARTFAYGSDNIHFVLVCFLYLFLLYSNFPEEKAIKINRYGVGLHTAGGLNRTKKWSSGWCHNCKGPATNKWHATQQHGLRWDGKPKCLYFS